MAAFGYKILEIKNIFSEQKTQVQSSTKKTVNLKELWKEFYGLLKSMSLSYANLGHSYSEEALKIKNYTSTMAQTEGLSKTLDIMSEYSYLVGEFYNTQSLNFTHQVENKYNEFSNQLDSFKFKINNQINEIFAQIDKIILNIHSDHGKLEKSLRADEEIQILIENVNKNTESYDQGYENKLKANKTKLSKEINTIQSIIAKAHDNFNIKINALKDLNTSIANFIYELELKCVENMESIIQNMISLALTLSEFKKNTSERLSQTIPNINFTENNEKIKILYNKELEFLIKSEKKIEILAFLKDYLSRITDIEENFDKKYNEHKISSMFFKNYKNNLEISVMKIMQELEEVFSFHHKYSKVINKKIVLPIETLIRVQSSLNSSIKISVKKVYLSFKKIEDQTLSSPVRSRSLSPLTTSIQEKLQKLKKNQSKEISELIQDHISKENTYISSIKNNLWTFNENNIRFYKNILELHTKIFSDSKSVYRYTNTSSSSFFSSLDQSFNQLREKSRNNFVANPDKNGTELEEFNRRFNMDSKEPVVASFLCAYSDGILLQGKLYITVSWLGFYSHFNSSTIVGRETIVKIQVSEILGIKKKTNMYIFDNSISIRTSYKKHFFTSFISRDEAYSILSQVSSMKVVPEPVRISSISFSIETRPFRLLVQSRLKEVQPKGLGESLFPDSYYTDSIFNPPIHLDAPIEVIYNLLYSDKSRDFTTKYLEASGEFDIFVSYWSKPPPSFDENFREGAGSRTIKVSHRLKERLPLMPAHCQVIERQNIFFIRRDKFIVEGEFEVNAMYGDYFKSYLRWTVFGTESVVVTAELGFVFSKSTIFSGKIIREGFKQTFSSLNNIWVPLAINTIKQYQGVEVPELIEPIKPIKKLEVRWELWGVIIVLTVIIIKLIQKIKKLETDLSKFQD